MSDGNQIISGECKRWAKNGDVEAEVFSQTFSRCQPLLVVVTLRVVLLIKLQLFWRPPLVAFPEHAFMPWELITRSAVAETRVIKEIRREFMSGLSRTPNHQRNM